MVATALQLLLLGVLAVRKLTMIIVVWHLDSLTNSRQVIDLGSLALEVQIHNEVMFLIRHLLLLVMLDHSLHILLLLHKWVLVHSLLTN